MSNDFWSAALLHVVHCIYYIYVLIRSFSKIFLNKTIPHRLDADRRRVPHHLALVFVLPKESHTFAVTGALIDSVERAVRWCQTAGIERLTVYDNKGLLVGTSQKICDRIVQHVLETDSDSEPEYPLTPPLSRPLSPEYSMTPEELNVLTVHLLQDQEVRPPKRKSVLTHRRPPKDSKRNLSGAPLVLHFVTRESSKQAIAAAAGSLGRAHLRSAVKKKSRGESGRFNLTVDVLESMLEGGQGLPPPDLLLVHSLDPIADYEKPLEIYGFPPWQIRLTEIFHCRYSGTPREWLRLLMTDSRQRVVSLDELQFRSALDEFAGAEMRLGK